MIMWELVSKKPPFSDYCHDIGLTFAVLDGQRPEVVKEMPRFYANIMKQCWNSDPLKRPDASRLPKIFEEMMNKCKLIDETTVSSNVSLCSSSSRSNLISDDNIEPGNVNIEMYYKFKQTFYVNIYVFFRIHDQAIFS
jgi:hypothetical protein